MWNRVLLGKVFISHSSLDKPFVRRLTKRLWTEGYDVWLDEKELVPGDALSHRLSETLAQSKVVIVVVTQNSLNSRWLKFELNKATERMVQGQCRVIPALKGAVELPPELRSVIYADFRRSFAEGIAGILRALNHEAQLALKNSWAELPVMLGKVFDEAGNASASSEYDSFDFDFVQIDDLRDPRQTRPGDPADIIYDVIHDYTHDKKPLTNSWLQEYLSTRDRYWSSFHLVVTERPLEFLSPLERNSRLRVYRERHYDGSRTFVVFADISGLVEAPEKQAVLVAAREQFLEIARELGWLVGVSPNSATPADA
jgi:hypothetical protein